MRTEAQILDDMRLVNAAWVCFRATVLLQRTVGKKKTRLETLEAVELLGRLARAKKDLERIAG